MKKLDALSLLSTYMLGNIAKNVHFPNLEGSCVKKRRKKSFASTGRGVQQYRKKGLLYDSAKKCAHKKRACFKKRGIKITIAMADTRGDSFANPCCRKK